MVPVNDDNVLIAGVRLVDILRMARLDEFIPVPRDKQRGHEAPRRVRYRADVVYVEPGDLLHAGFDHPYGDAYQQARGEDALPASLLDHLLGKLHQAAETAVQHHAADGRIPLHVHERRRRSHAPAPQRDGGDDVGGPQVPDHAVQVLLLVVPEGDVLAVGLAGAGEVEGEEGDAEGEDVGEDADGLGVDGEGGVRGLVFF